jgi:hypothetical protein
MPGAPLTPPDARGRLSRLAAKFGLFASILVVFTCGWLAMRTDDWKRIVLLTALALVAGVVASAFSRRTK